MLRDFKNLVRSITPPPLLEYRQRKRRVILQEEARLEAMVGPPGLFRESRDFQLRFLRTRGMRPKHQFLDIGCGPLRGGIPLIQYLAPGGYTGIDIRPAAVNEGLIQLRKHTLTKKRATVLLSRTFGQDELGATNFDFIWCFQLFYHLEDNQVATCLQSAASLLKINGACYATVNTHADEGRWQEFPYRKRSTGFYELLAHRSGLEMNDLGQLKDHGFTRKATIGQFHHMLEFRLQT